MIRICITTRDWSKPESRFEASYPRLIVGLMLSVITFAALADPAKRMRAYTRFQDQSREIATRYKHRELP